MSQDRNKQIMAQNIKKYMEQKGVTNQQLCDALGFKYTTFVDWIKAVTYPRMPKVEAMANYFGCEKSDLIEEKKPGIGETIMAARLEKGISQNALAELIGVKPHKIGMWEKGNVSDIKKSDLHKLAESLDLDAVSLLRRIEDTPVALAEGLASIYLDEDLQKMIVEYNSLDNQRKEQAREYVHFLASKN